MVNVVALAYVQVSHAEIQPSAFQNTRAHVPTESLIKVSSCNELVDANCCNHTTLSALSVFKLMKLSLIVVLEADCTSVHWIIHIVLII